jgi:hypothetical protein
MVERKYSVNPGSLVSWLDPWKTKRLGLVMRSRFVGTGEGQGYYDVLVNGKIMFCHRNNLEIISENKS